MLDHAQLALEALFEPVRLLALFGGMLVGMVFGMLPGLGGVAAVSILLPFIYYLDDFSGLAMLLGAVSVVYTSDTITSVLIGAPGSPASSPSDAGASSSTFGGCWTTRTSISGGLRSVVPAGSTRSLA